MKNVKLYKWLTVTLMLAISVFCLLYLEKIQKSTAPAVAETKTEHTAETDKPERPVFYNTLPKSAYSYNGQQFQNIGGDDDDILKNVHTFGKTACVFFDTSSNGYDVKTAAPSVACALVDENLTLKKPQRCPATVRNIIFRPKSRATGFSSLRNPTRTLRCTK